MQVYRFFTIVIFKAIFFELVRVTVDRESRVLKVVGNEKIGGSGKCQMLGYGSGLWRSRFIFCLNMQFLS
jgi:hypothetical protein